MASQKQLEANRRNATRSTGPRTASGKAASSRNAVTHGLTARKIPVLPGEDSAEFEALREALVRDLKPIGILQREIVDDIAQIRWKLRRVPRVEAALAERQIPKIARRDKFARQDGLLPADFQQADAVAVLAVEFECESEKSFAQLELYRHRLERSMHASLRELRKLREETAGEEEKPSEEDAPADRSSGVDDASNDGENLSTEPNSASFKNEAVSEDNSLSAKCIDRAENGEFSSSCCSTGFQPVPSDARSRGEARVTNPCYNKKSPDSSPEYSSPPESLPNTDSPNISGR